jgi:hypothetical protein
VRDAGPQDALPDPSAALFEADRLLRVEIDLAPQDWDQLRSQTRTLEDTLAREQCLDELFASPYSYFSARVTVDGTALEPVGVRKKGFLGSLSELKPSLKIKLDEYVPSLEHLGLSSLTLNNGRQDPSLIKPCIGLERMRRAGVAAPRCSYAEVIVNGTSLGPYVHVEGINRRFLRRAFGEDSGQLYEGTLSDFRPGWLGTFEQETREEVPYDRADLEALTQALTRPDAELLAALEPLVDLDAFQRFWAAEVLIEHWDGYSGNTNNFYLYRRERDRRFVFIPWGVDGILGAQRGPPFSVYAQGELARRLYLHPDGRRRYLDTLDATLAEAWDPAVIGAEIDRAATLVAPAVPAEQRSAVAAATAALRTFVAGRQAELRGEIDAGGVAWTAPPRDRPCFDSGALVAELGTTFGTHPAPNIFTTGQGTYTATLAGVSSRGQAVGASAGFGTNPDDQNQVVLLVAATLPDGSIPVVYVVIDPALFQSGAQIPIDGQRARGALLRFPRAGAPLEVVAFMWSGLVEVGAGDTTAGAVVEARVSANLLRQR